MEIKHLLSFLQKVTIGNGGRVGFRSWRNDKHNFYLEMRTLAPSILVSMPPLWNELYADYENELEATLSDLKEKGTLFFII